MEYENEIEEYLQGQIQDKRNINISPRYITYKYDENEVDRKNI